MRHVRDHEGLDLRWRFFSLEEVNLEEGKRHPWERPWSFGWSQMRIAALLRRRGSELVDRWYGAAGEAFFERGEATFTPTGAESVVQSIGLPARTVDVALKDETTNTEVLQDHRYLIDQFGGFGVPTIVVSDEAHEPRAVFGPVILTPPQGDEAIKLWNTVLAFNEVPDLYEMRRPKKPEDITKISSTMAGYAAARQWRTIVNPAP
jgi:hypothetical protein